MRHSSRLASLAVASMVPAHAAQAQSLKRREMTARDSAKVADLARETNQACGTEIKFQVDYASYATVLDDDDQSPWANLANATDALKRVCRSDAGKQAVRARITSVTVAHGVTETEALRGSGFRYSVPCSGLGPGTVVSWLGSNL